MIIVNEVGTTFYAVGLEPVVLKNVVPAEQRWLGFVDALLVEAGEPVRIAKKKKKKAKGSAVTLPTNSKTILANLVKQCDGKHKPSRDEAMLFRHVRGVEQITLPFPDRRHIVSTEAELIMKAGYPGFEKTGHGAPHSLAFKRKRHSEVEAWCDVHCVGRFLFASRSVIFEQYGDFYNASGSLGNQSQNAIS